MILEGIVTSLGADGAVNIAPMGPIVDADMTHLVLRPFRTARTYANLKQHGEGVFHITDDVLLLARAALGQLDPMPELVPAKVVHGFALASSCRYYEFRVVTCDDRDERARFEVEVVHKVVQREFIGFNRAKNAVVEAAILATRIGILPITEIHADFARLAVIVRKTGAAQEHEAFALLAAAAGVA